MNSNYVKGTALLVLLLISFAAPVYAQNATRDVAVNAIGNAEKDIREIAGAGFSTAYVNDALNAARLALERADFAELIRKNATGSLAEEARKALEGLNYEGFTYDEVLKITEQITQRKKQAYLLSDSIRSVEIRIGDLRNQGIDVADAEDILEGAELAFQKDRYDETEILLLKARSVLEEKRAEATTLAAIVESGKSYFERNWVGFVIAFVVIGFSTWFAWKLYRLKSARSGLRRMKIERNVLVRLMKKAQVERFETAEISESVYEIRMEKYNERLEEIKRRIPVLEAAIKRGQFNMYFSKMFGKPEKVTKVTKKIKPEKKIKKKKISWTDRFKIKIFSRPKEKKVEKLKKIKPAPIKEIQKPERSFFENIREALKQIKIRNERQEKKVERKIEKQAEEIKISRYFEPKKEEPKIGQANKTNLLSEISGRMGSEMNRMRQESQRKGALKKLYSGQKSGYVFSGKPSKSIGIGLRLKRFIGKIRFKIS